MLHLLWEENYRLCSFSDGGFFIVKFFSPYDYLKAKSSTKGEDLYFAFFDTKS